MTPKQRKKLRAQKIQALQKGKELANKEQRKENELKGTIDHLSRLLSSHHLLVSASQLLVDEIEEFMKLHRLTPKSFTPHFKALLDANTNYFKLMSKITPQERVIDWANDIEKFKIVYTNFLGYDAFGSGINVSVDVDSTEYRMHYLYNRMRVHINGRSFKMKELQQIAREVKAPYYSKAIPALRQLGIIQPDGNLFRFKDDIITMQHIDQIIKLSI